MSKEKWISFCQSRNMWLVRFARNVPTHWNSTYKLFCQSDKYKYLLCDFMRYNVSYILLHLIQWYMYSKIYQLLKVFNDVTNTFFDIYYSTTNLFIIESFNIVGAYCI